MVVLEAWTVREMGCSVGVFFRTGDDKILSLSQAEDAPNSPSEFKVE